MEPSTWKAFCKSIMTMTGPPLEALPVDRIEKPFKCTLCGMEFITAMKLQGVKHKAALVDCGGYWQPTEPVSREQPPGDGNPAP